MADIDAVLAGLTTEELAEIRARGPKGHLSRHLLDALDRAAGGPDAARGLYILDGMVNDNGGQFYILRDDLSERIFRSPANGS
ncbi:hypothetical protein FJ661_10075 [Pseudarthrobacter phenanthrenivorans]|uniref:hypothetical protein n=1 Tax=Pseudarthrobacter phenanthrenivorans TaxID=361575 RepID=UPI0011267523|nr:hypothetical protein [Pseudarthrobacter phenanthrenivorans]TPV51101.1 hypothetical protein FJ661_10075 [Pseudarthrobacter phenanthrenivorans]